MNIFRFVGPVPPPVVPIVGHRPELNTKQRNWIPSKPCGFALRLAVVAVATLLFAGKLLAQADVGVLVIVPEPDPKDLRTFVELARADIKAQKAVILAQNMEFTADEAVDFWPLYRDYDLEFTKLLDQRLTLIKRYAGVQKIMTDADASKLADEALSIEEKRTALKRKYFKKFAKVIGAKKAARFIQIENQINTAIDLRISASLPLIK